MEKPIDFIGETYFTVLMQNIVDHLVSLFGSQALVAKAAKCKQPSVSDWRSTNEVPMRRARHLLKAAAARGLVLTPEHFFMATPKKTVRRKRKSVAKQSSVSHPGVRV